MEVSARAAELNEALLSPTAPSRWRTLRLIMVVGGVSIGTSFQFGFGTGALNNLEDVAPAALAAAGGPLVLWQWSLIVSGFSIGGLLGSIAVSCLTMRYSRKTVLLLCNIFVFASSGLLMTGTAWPVLLLGRVCIGLVAGIGSAVVPMYLAEISPTSARSAVGTAHQVGINLGCLCAYALTTPSLQLLGDATSWRYAFVVPVCCSLVQLVILPFCPESPAYVYRTVGSHAALRKLEELHTPGSIGGHIDALRDEASMLGGPAESGFTVRAATPTMTAAAADAFAECGLLAWCRLSALLCWTPLLAVGVFSSPTRVRCACVVRVVRSSRSYSARVSCAASCSSASSSSSRCSSPVSTPSFTIPPSPSAARACPTLSSRRHLSELSTWGSPSSRSR